MAEVMNLIPEKDYVSACDFIRETDGSTKPILSGELAERVEDIISLVLENQTLPKAFLGSNKIYALRSGALMNVKVDRIYFPNLSPVSGVGAGTFEGCTVTKIEADDLRSLKFGHRRWMAYCGDLTYARFPNLVKLGDEGFKDCTQLKTLILEANEVASYDFDSLAGTPIIRGTGYVYVPKALVEQYKTTGAWRDIASQIRAIEDYPDIVNPPTP